MATPTISKEEFKKLGFVQTFSILERQRQVDPEVLDNYKPNKDDIWFVRYEKDLNPTSKEIDFLCVEWSTCNGRYRIYRDTTTIRNIPLFDGFIPSTKELEFLMGLFDLRKFYQNK